MRVTRCEILLFLMLWGTFAYFRQGEGWNPNTRLALTYALVERGSARIEAYWREPGMYTNDVAVVGQQVYSDKIIGTSLLGIPAFAVVHMVERVRGSAFSFETRRYFTTLFSVGLLAAAAGVVMRRVLMLICTGRPRNATGATSIVLLMFFGTQLLFYSTIFMAYLPTVFFELALLYSIERWRTAEPSRAPRWFTWGLLAGAALLCEYTALFVVAPLLIYAMFIASRREDSELRLAALARLGVGCVLPLLPFFVYLFVVFGRLSIPYQYEFDPMFRWFMSQGVMGTRAPRPFVLYLITVHPYRGFFFHSPYLLLVIPGFYLMLRSGRKAVPASALGVTILAAFIVLLVFNSGYYMWWGGWSFGARIVIPALALLCVPLHFVWTSGRWVPAATLLLALPAVFVHTVVQSVDPQVRDLNQYTPLDNLLYPEASHPYVWTFPVFVLPDFLSGRLQANFGRLVELPGPWSIAPLIVWWIAGTVLLVVCARREHFRDAPT